MNVRIYFHLSQRGFRGPFTKVTGGYRKVRANGRGFHMKGVLFDFDGTLTQPGAIDFVVIKQTIGCPRDMAILEFIELQPPKNRVVLMEILQGYEAKAARLSTPNRGAEACLSTLRMRDIPMGIITRNSLQSVASALQQFDGIECRDFHAVITRETAPPKPSPEGVFKAAALMDCLAEELVVVGDFRFDVIAGKKAGAGTILLTNGGGINNGAGRSESGLHMPASGFGGGNSFGNNHFALTRSVCPGKMVLRGVSRFILSRVERSIWCF